MKKQLMTAALLGVLIAAGCKKDEKEPEVSTPAVVSPPSTEFTNGFKIEDNKGGSIISDSAVCTPKATYRTIDAYRGKVGGEAFEHVSIAIKKAPLKKQVYTIDSLNLSSCYLTFGGVGDKYEIVSGSLTISDLSESKVSGTFTFGVVPAVGPPDGRTEIKGTFKNIRVKN